MEWLSFKIFPLDGRISKFLLFQLRNTSLQEDDNDISDRELEKRKKFITKMSVYYTVPGSFFAKYIVPLMLIILHTLLCVCITRTIKDVWWYYLLCGLTISGSSRLKFCFSISLPPPQIPLIWQLLKMKWSRGLNSIFYKNSVSVPQDTKLSKSYNCGLINHNTSTES